MNKINHLIKNNTLAIRIVLHLSLASPFLYSCWLLFLAFNGDINALGGDPEEEILEFYGKWSIRILLLTLAISPLQHWLAWPTIPFRRLFGLWTFFYLAIHLSVYVGLIIGLDFSRFLEDIFKRRFIYFGMIGFVLLIPLAITSTRGWQRRLRKNWLRLHKLVYISVVLGLIHYFLQFKNNISLEFATYIVILSLLFLSRIVLTIRKKQALKKS